MNHQSMMAEKPPDDGHRQNILSTSFNLVGIDVLVDAHQKCLAHRGFCAGIM
jgi:hypothetical protein